MDEEKIEVSEETRRKILKLRNEMYKEVDVILSRTENEILWLLHKDKLKQCPR